MTKSPWLGSGTEHLKLKMFQKIQTPRLPKFLEKNQWLGLFLRVEHCVQNILGVFWKRHYLRVRKEPFLGFRTVLPVSQQARPLHHCGAAIPGRPFPRESTLRSPFRTSLCRTVGTAESVACAVFKYHLGRKVKNPQYFEMSFKWMSWWKVLIYAMKSLLCNFS